MKTIKYTGNERGWDELQFTGKQSVWYPGQIDSRSDAEAAQLIGTGFFVAEQLVGKILYDTAAPSDADGRPDGTIVFYPAA